MLEKILKVVEGISEAIRYHGDCQIEAARLVIQDAYNAPVEEKPLSTEQLVTQVREAAKEDGVIQDEDNTDSTPDNPEDVDKSGVPWDERIHSSNKKMTSKGVWQRRKNVPDSLFDSVMAELIKGESVEQKETKEEEKPEEKVKEEEKPEEKPEVEEETKGHPGEDIAVVRQVLKDFAISKGSDVARTLLEDHGIKKISEADVNTRIKLYDAMMAVGV